MKFDWLSSLRRNRFGGRKRVLKRNRLRRGQSLLKTEALEERILLAANLGLVQEGLRGDYFSDLQNELNDDVFKASLPFIGDQLSTSDEGQFIAGIGDALKTFMLDPDPTIAQVKTELASKLVAFLPGGESDINVVVVDEGNEIIFNSR